MQRDSGRTATINLAPGDAVVCTCVNQQNTAVLTTQVSDAGTVFPSTAVHDTATVNGNQAADTPSGTVTFLCSQVPTGGSCGTGGANIGTGTLSGADDTAHADSPNVNTAASPLPPGRYCFRAEWPGGRALPAPFAVSREQAQVAAGQYLIDGERRQARMAAARAASTGIAAILAAVRLFQ